MLRLLHPRLRRLSSTRILIRRTTRPFTLPCQWPGSRLCRTVQTWHRSRARRSWCARPTQRVVILFCPDYLPCRATLSYADLNLKGSH
jgi:hypothetical protein